MILEVDTQGNVEVKQTYTPPKEDRNFAPGALTSLYIKKSSAEVKHALRPLKAQFTFEKFQNRYPSYSLRGLKIKASGKYSTYKPRQKSLKKLTSVRASLP